MSDLIERLRDEGSDPYWDKSVIQELLIKAADALEEKDAEIAALKDQLQNHCAYCTASFPAGEEGFRKLKIHIGGCPYHPVYQLDLANTELRTQLSAKDAETKRLREALTVGINSPRELCALMAEGEGNDVSVYRSMALNAMNQMDAALEETK